MKEQPNWLDVLRWQSEISGTVNFFLDMVEEDELARVIEEIWRDGYDAGYDTAEEIESYSCEGH